MHQGKVDAVIYHHGKPQEDEIYLLTAAYGRKAALPNSFMATRERAPA